MEALTYRQKGHSRSDPATYRPEGELETWLERDPIVVDERALREAGVTDERIEAAHAEAQAAVEAALQRAKDWSEPDAESRLEHVYA